MARRRRRVTRRQAEALNWIRAYWGRHDHGPTLLEVAGGLGIKKPSAWELVHALLAVGALEDLGPARAARRFAPVDDEPESCRIRPDPVGSEQRPSPEGLHAQKVREEEAL